MSQEAFDGQDLAAVLREKLGEGIAARPAGMVGRLNPAEVVLLRRHAQVLPPGAESERVKRVLALHPLDPDQEQAGLLKARAGDFVNVAGLTARGRFQVMSILSRLGRAGL